MPLKGAVSRKNLEAKNTWVLYTLKGQCHEIFAIFLESTWAPYEAAKTVLRNFSFSQRYTIAKFENRVQTRDFSEKRAILFLPTVQCTISVLAAGLFELSVWYSSLAKYRPNDVPLGDFNFKIKH